MIESIKNELYKSLHNKLFAISMIIAFIIQIFSVQPNAAFKNEALEHYLTTSSMGGVSNKVFFESFDIYTFWIGIEGVSMGCYLSKYLIPILAVLPFGWSFLSEQKKGYQIQTVSRIGKANYFISKYIATFISGALPTAFILLSNYAVLALICPLHTPSIDSLTTGIQIGMIGSSLFYKSAFLFMLMWTGISSLWAGTLAGLTMVASQFMKTGIFVMLFPFFITILWDNICNVIINNPNLSFLNLFFVNDQSGYILFGEILVLFIAGFGVGGLMYMRNDIL